MTCRHPWPYFIISDVLDRLGPDDFSGIANVSDLMTS